MPSPPPGKTRKRKEVSAMTISYIDQLNSFHTWLLTNRISSSARLLWYSLLHINNSTGWKSAFNVSMEVLKADTGLSDSAIKRARNTLLQSGLIDFSTRPGGQSSVYSVARLAAVKNLYDRGTEPGTEPGTDRRTDRRTEPGTDRRTEPGTGRIPRVEEKRIEENIKAAAGARAKDTPFSNVFKAYQDNVHPITGPIEQDGLRDLLDTYGEKWVLAGIEEAAKNNGRSLKYISAILKRWEREGFKTDRKKPGGGIPMVRSAPNKADEENLATILSIIGE